MKNKIYLKFIYCLFIPTLFEKEIENKNLFGKQVVKIIWWEYENLFLASSYNFISLINFLTK